MSLIHMVRRFVVGAGLAASLALAPQAPAFAQSAPAASAPASVASADATLDASKKPDASSNPYGIEALWKNSDAITKTVLLLLAIMSMGSWYFLVVKVLCPVG